MIGGEGDGQGLVRRDGGAASSSFGGLLISRLRVSTDVCESKVCPLCILSAPLCAFPCSKRRQCSACAERLHGLLWPQPLHHSHPSW